MKGWGSRRARTPPPRPGNPAASPTNAQPRRLGSGILRPQEPPLANDLRELKTGDDFTQAGGSVSQPVITARPGPRYTRLGTLAEKDLDMHAFTWCIPTGTCAQIQVGV